MNSVARTQSVCAPSLLYIIVILLALLGKQPPVGAYFQMVSNSGDETFARPQRTTTISVGQEPNGIAINEEASRIYIANQKSSTISVIDGSSLEVVESIAVPEGPYWQLAYDPGLNRVYVSSNKAHALAVINADTNTVIDVVEELNYQPEGVGFSSQRNHVYVTHGTSSFTVVDRTTLEAIDSVNTGQFNHLIEVDAASNLAYVSKSGPGQIAIIDLVDLVVAGSITTTANPWEMELDPSGAILYAVVTGGAVDVVDLAEREVITSIRVGKYPQGLALSSETGCLYVANAFSNTVSIISSRTMARLATVSVGRWPNDIAINVSTGQVFVTNKLDNTVTVFDEPNCSSATHSNFLPFLLK